jgi:hypothetical protein
MLVGGGSYAAPTAGGSGSGGPLDDVAAGRAAIVLHNGRLLLTPLPPALDNAADTAVATAGGGTAAPGAGALHELDLVLLSSVERSKVGTAVAALVPPATGASGAAGAAEEEAADALVGMVSFCGRYAAGGGRRFDVMTALAEAEVLPKVRAGSTGDE